MRRQKNSQPQSVVTRRDPGFKTGLGGYRHPHWGRSTLVDGLAGSSVPRPSPQRKRGVQLALNPLIQEAVRRGGLQSSEPQAFLPGLSKPRKCGTGEKKKHRFIKGKRCDGSCYHRPLTCGRRFLSGGGEIVLLL